MKLAGARILVTGATGGIGGALARALAKAGARLVVHGRDDGRMRRLQATLPAGTAGVLLDEPLNALDERARQAVLQLLAEALQGPRIWLVASHEALPAGARLLRL